MAWYDDSNFNFSLLVACIIFFLSTLLWPLGAVFNRGLKKPRTGRLATAARWLAGGSSILNLVFMIGLLSMFLANPAEADFIYAIPPWLSALFAIALIAAVLALGSAAFAVLAWKDGYWGLTGRVHYRIVVLVLLAFIWWLNNWNLIGFRF